MNVQNIFKLQLDVLNPDVVDKCDITINGNRQMTYMVKSILSIFARPDLYNFSLNFLHEGWGWGC